MTLFWLANVEMRSILRIVFGSHARYIHMFSVPRNLGSRPEPVLQIEIQATTPNQPKPGFQSNPLIQTKQDMSKGLLDTCSMEPKPKRPTSPRRFAPARRFAGPETMRAMLAAAAAMLGTAQAWSSGRRLGPSRPWVKNCNVNPRSK